MLTDPSFPRREFREIVTAMLEDLRAGVGERAALTDTAEGSVVRTLVEAFSRQLAVAHEQLEWVYRSAYLDTAEGAALEHVTALLGVVRRRPGRVEGTVKFSRLLPAPDDIYIPAGTLVTGQDAPVFETVGNATLPRGATEITVRVGSRDEGAPEVPPGGISLMPRPVWGLEGVTNLEFLRPGDKAEGDDELRERAGKALRRANLGTPAALEEAVRSLGLTKVRVREMPLEKPGEVEVVIADPGIPEHRLEAARQAVEDARPAGIRVRVRAVSRIGIRIHAELALDRNRPEPEVGAIREGLLQELRRYFDGIAVNDNVRWSKVRNILTGHDAVMDLAPVASLPYLTPFLFEEGAWTETPASSRTLVSGDLFLGETERAELIEANLSFRPPAPVVWVDVLLKGPAERAGLHAAIEAALNRFLESVSSDDLLTFQALAEKVPSSLNVSALRFTLIHVVDGRVAELKDAVSVDRLAGDERPKVRTIEFAAGANG